MVFLVLTRSGLDELKAQAGGIPSMVWVNHGLLTEAETEQLRASGIQVEPLSDEIDATNAVSVAAAVETIRQRHGHACVWVEHAAHHPFPSMLSVSEQPARQTGMQQWRHVPQAVAAKADDLLGAAWRRWRNKRSSAPFMIIPYAGYGTRYKLLLSGRVIRNKNFRELSKEGKTWQNLVELYKLLESDEISGARVRARFQDVVVESVANSEGYFFVELQLTAPLAVPGWHTVALELVDPPSRQAQVVEAAGRVLIPPENARFGVISDIDDTVVWTNVTNKLKMLIMLARSNAYTRKPFKGVAAFYQALRDGATGDEGNPIFYVSSSPWNLYTPLVEFMAVNGIPGGPLLLRDFGRHIFFSSHQQDHKLKSIEKILSTFPHLPFILIGDSGERDPEIYTQVLKDYPGRVYAIYIRNVNPDPSRVEAIDRLAEEVRQAGAHLVLTPDSEFAAVHAAGEGWISAQSLASVRLDKKEDSAINAVSGADYSA